MHTHEMHLEGAQIIPYSIFLDKLVRKRTAHLIEACARDIQEAKDAIRSTLRDKLKAQGYGEDELP